MSSDMSCLESPVLTDARRQRSNVVADTTCVDRPIRVTYDISCLAGASANPLGRTGVWRVAYNLARQLGTDPRVDLRWSAFVSAATRQASRQEASADAALKHGGGPDD